MRYSSSMPTVATEESALGSIGEPRFPEKVELSVLGRVGAAVDLELKRDLNARDVHVAGVQLHHRVDALVNGAD